MASLGSTYVAVKLQFADAAKQATKFGKDAGLNAGKTFAQQFTRITKESIKPVEYQVNLSKRDIQKLQRQLNELSKGRAAALAIDPKVDTAEVDKQIKVLRNRINVARAGMVGITVDPNSVKEAGAKAEAAGLQVGKRFSGALHSAMSLGLSLAGFAVAGFAAHSLKAAADFQSSMTLLVTAGGENRKALGMISAGIKDLAVSTGTSVDQLSEGMYTIEKAGIRGAKGLDVLKAAAQGARAENVDLGTMTNALTSIMASYGSKMRDPIKATNELVAAAGASKTTMQDFAGALSTVQPIAAAAHIPFNQLGGAIATLTAHGTSAQEATQELANTIRSLQAPNAVAQKEMAQFGLNANDVSTQLGKRGLQGTIDLLSQTVLSKMGPSGKILLGTFNASKIAAQDANIMFGKLPAGVQKVAKSYVEGRLSLKDWRNELKAMTPASAALAQQWASAENKSKAFNDQLRSGTPEARTYISSLRRMMGGATGLNTALQLTGESAHRFTEATKEIGDAGAKTGKNVSTWAATQKTFNVQLDRLKQTVQVAGITLGAGLIPVVLSLAKAFMTYVVPAIKTAWLALQPVFTFAQQHTTTFKILALSLLTFWTAFKTLSGAVAIVKGISTSFKALNTAMKANVVLLIVSAIIALGVAFYEAYTHSERFRNDVNRVLNDIKTVALAVVHWFTGPFVNFFTRTLPGAIKTAIDWVAQHWKFMIFVSPFITAIALIITHWRGLVDFFKTAASDIVKGFHAFIDFFTQTVPNVFMHTIPNAVMWLVHWIADHWKFMIFVLPFITAIALIIVHWRGLWNGLVAVIQGAWKVLRVIGLLIYGIIALPAVLAFDAIRYAALKVWGWIGPYVMGALRLLTGIVRTSMLILNKYWSETWGAIKGAALASWHAVSGFFVFAFRQFIADCKTDWHLIVLIITSAFYSIVRPLESAWNTVSGWIARQWHAFAGWTGRQWHTFVLVITDEWDRIVKPLQSAWNSVSGWLSKEWDKFNKLVSTKWGIISESITGAFSNVSSSLGGIWDTTKRYFFDGLNGVIWLINEFLKLIHKVPGVPLWHIDKVGQPPSNSNARSGGGGNSGGRNVPSPTFAAGGVMPGYTPGRDVHAFYSPTAGALALSGGESVMVPQWTRLVGGEPTIAAWNDAAKRGPAALAAAMGMPVQHHLLGGVIKDIGAFGGWAGGKVKAGALASVHAVEGVFRDAVNGAVSVAGAGINKLPGGALIHGLAHGVLHAIAQAITGGGNSDIAKGYTPTSGGAIPAAAGAPAANRALGMRIAQAMGYGSQFSAIDYVASHESGWNNLAQNPTSTAYGIGQFLNSTWAAFGHKTSVAADQIRYMIQYMVQRYGSPIGAMRHWMANHSYGKGGTPRPGETAIVGEHGPELVHFANGGVVHNAADTKAILAAHNQRASLLATGHALLVEILAGMNGAATTSQISKVTGDIIGKIDRAFTGSRKSALVTWVTNENTALQRLAKQRDSISSQISAANAYATNVRGAAKSNAALTGLSDTSGVNTIQAGLQAKLKATNQFTADIKTLSREGLSRELIGQLIDAGVDQGGPIARQLAKASRARIQQINTTQRGIDTASARLGTTATNFKFGDNASADFVAGMVKRRSALSHEMSLMAESFARHVREAFRMKASGTHPKATHDNGGWLMPFAPAINMTGHPEAVLSPHQWQLAEAALARGGGASADDIGKAIAAYMDGATLHISPNGLTRIVNTQNVRNQRKAVSGR